MTHLNCNDIDTASSPNWETPVFDPRSAFARTLRSGEIARHEHRQYRNGLVGSTTVVSVDAASARTAHTDELPRREFETPTFHPRSAFARTLRSGEIARLEREQRHAEARQPIAAAA